MNTPFVSRAPGGRTSARPDGRDRHSRESGFTLVEMVVGLAVMTEVILVILLLFDVNSELSRVQTQNAEMQQSQRIAQYEIVRLISVAGRGGLDSARSIAVETQVPDGTHIGDSDSPLVSKDTDVLTVRGAFRSPIFLVDYQNPGNLQYQADDSTLGPTEGRVTINRETITRIEQPLDRLTRMIEESQTGDALIMVSAVSDGIFAVTRIVEVTGNSESIQIRFSFDGSDERTASYLALSCCGGGFPIPLDQPIAFVGILEEFRYYIREARAVAGDDTTEMVPRLTRAQFYPNTDTPWLDDLNLQVDVADNIIDLQVALAIDANGDGTIQEDEDDDPDEWLYNEPGESRIDQTIAGEEFNMLTGPAFWARISTVARSQGQDPQYVAPKIEGSIEDRAYAETEIPSSDTNRLERLHRRRFLRSTVDLRNL